MKKRIFEAIAVCLFCILEAWAAFYFGPLQEKTQTRSGQGVQTRTAEGAGRADEVSALMNEPEAGGKADGMGASSGDSEEGLPIGIWTEPVACGESSCQMMFERISPLYAEKPDTPAEPFYLADYRLSLWDADGALVSEQTVTEFPVCFEEVYWIRDFSGDGFADLAFCTTCENHPEYRRTYMMDTFYIWNAQRSLYETSALPLEAPSNYSTVGVPLWNEELSSVISFAGDDPVMGNPVLEMYSFLGGEWQKIRRLESIYSEDAYYTDRPDYSGERRELLYADGNVTGETIVESNYDAGTIWCRGDSVWSRYYEGNLSLYPDERYWEMTEVSMGGISVEKYVRSQAYRREHDNWHDMLEDWELPYVDDDTFAFLKDAYADVDFTGVYEQGDIDTYPLYLDAFYKLIREDALLRDRATGETMTISEYPFFKECLFTLEEGEDEYQIKKYTYYFFDMDGDGAPELTVYQPVVGFVVLDYDAGTDTYTVWYDAEACWFGPLGSKKVLWTWDGRYLAYYQLNENGDVACETFCGSWYYNGEEAVYLVMLPMYAEDGERAGLPAAEGGVSEGLPAAEGGVSEGLPAAEDGVSEGLPVTGDGVSAGLPAAEGGASERLFLSEERKAQGVYSRADGQWYFRVNGKQYEEITEAYWEAYESVYEHLDQEAYTYEELFGALDAETAHAGENAEGGDVKTVFDAGSRLGARIAAYRVPWEEVKADSRYKTGDYIAIEDLDGGVLFYIPDEYGELVDIQVTEAGICIRDRDLEDGTLREHQIPGCFLFSKEYALYACDSSGNHWRRAILQGTDRGDTLPQQVWQERFEYGTESLEMTFERISPFYCEGFAESAAGMMADYCLTVRNNRGEVLSAQKIVSYPADYEQVHWLIDFSGDGFPDLAFCTSIMDGTYYHSAQTYFLIWNAEAQAYENQPLPRDKTAAGTRFSGFVYWVPQLSAVWTNIAADEYGNEIDGMFSFINGEWQLIRSLRNIYSETEIFDDPRWNVEYPVVEAYREQYYQDGEPVQERIRERSWDGTQGRLYPRGDEWTWDETEIGGVTFYMYRYRQVPYGE